MEINEKEKLKHNVRRVHTYMRMCVCVFDNEAFNEKYYSLNKSNRMERMSNLIFKQLDVRLLSMEECGRI